MTLAEAARPLNSPSFPRLMLVTDARRLPDPRAALARLPAGSAVLLRHPDAAGRAALAALVMGVARRRRLVVLVSEDWRLAARIGAAGVHLPERLGRGGRLAEVLGWARRRGGLVTMACHNPAALAAAKRLGADAALLSPVFATASHPGARPIGPVRFAAWVRRAGLPVLALGGVDAAAARRLRGSKAAGVAAIGGLS